MSLNGQIEVFRRLAGLNRSILSRLEQGSLDLEALFESRRQLLESLAGQAITAAEAAAEPSLVQTLAASQADAARLETKIAEALAKIVSPNEKLELYRRQNALPKPGKQWDTLG